MTRPPGRFPWTAALSAVLLLALFEYLFFVPLRPEAWGGPRGDGFFEEGELPKAGWFARDARLYIEDLAKWRSPNAVLEGTAEALGGYHGLLMALRFGILWLILRRTTGRCCLASALVVASAVPMMLGGTRQTDVDVGLVFFVALMALTTPTRISWATVVGLPTLFALWANAHTSALVGLGWVGVILVGRAIEWWRAYENFEDDRPAMPRLFIAYPLCIAATCLNPDGPRIFVDAVAFAKNPNIPVLTGWQPIDFSKPAGFPWFYFATIAALLFAQLVGRRVFSPTAILVILSFGFWPLLQQRGQDYWWLIVPWLSAPLFGSAVEWLRGEPRSQPSPPRFRWALMIVLGLAVLATPAVRWLILGKARTLEAITSRETPARLAQQLANPELDSVSFLDGFRAGLQNYPDRKYRGAILTGEEQGDFLAWVLDGDNTQPVLIYTRPETMDPPHWAECHRALDGESAWWEILGRQQVNLVVIDPRRYGKLAERLRKDPEWSMVQDQAALVVALRKEPKLPPELMRP
jgi:hypothetical protein